MIVLVTITQRWRVAKLLGFEDHLVKPLKLVQMYHSLREIEDSVRPLPLMYKRFRTGGTSSKTRVLVADDNHSNVLVS